MTPRPPTYVQSARLLTPRQVEILQLIAEDMTDDQVATRLNLSVATVRTHVKHIRSSLGVGSRTGAVVKAFREGVIA